MVRDGRRFFFIFYILITTSTSMFWSPSPLDINSINILVHHLMFQVYFYISLRTQYSYPNIYSTNSNLLWVHSISSMYLFRSQLNCDLRPIHHWLSSCARHPFYRTRSSSMFLLVEPLHVKSFQNRPKGLLYP